MKNEINKMSNHNKQQQRQKSNDCKTFIFAIINKQKKKWIWKMLLTQSYTAKCCLLPYKMMNYDFISTSKQNWVLGKLKKLIATILSEGSKCYLEKQTRQCECSDKILEEKANGESSSCSNYW